MDVNQLPAAGFFFTNEGDVVRFVFCRVKVGHWVENDALRTISVGFHLASFLRACLKETFVLRLKLLNNSLAETMTCAGFIWSIHQKPRFESIHLLLFIYFLLCIIITVH